MLTLRGIITILVLAGLFALAVVWISKQGKAKAAAATVPPATSTAILRKRKRADCNAPGWLSGGILRHRAP